MVNGLANLFSTSKGNELIFTSGTEKKLWDSDNEACHEEERFPSPVVAPTNGSGAVLKTGK